jgi:hypothetical protein
MGIKPDEWVPAHEGLGGLKRAGPARLSPCCRIISYNKQKDSTPLGHPGGAPPDHVRSRDSRAGFALASFKAATASAAQCAALICTDSRPRTTFRESALVRNQEGVFAAHRRCPKHRARATPAEFQKLRTSNARASVRRLLSRAQTIVPRTLRARPRRSRQLRRLCAASNWTVASVFLTR